MRENSCSQGTNMKWKNGDDARVSSKTGGDASFERICISLDIG